MSRPLKNWQDLASEVKAWADANYSEPSQPWQLLMGVVEEVGEFFEERKEFRSFMNTAKLVDSIGDQTIYALNLCLTVGIPIEPISDAELSNTWRHMPLLHHPSPRWHYTQPSSEDLMIALGRAARGLLKNSQNIRGMGRVQMVENVSTALRWWEMWVNRQVRICELPTHLEITNSTWEQVRKRNWKENPLTGG